MPRSRADSAETMKIPEPIIEPTTSAVASTSPMRRRGAPDGGCMGGRNVTSSRLTLGIATCVFRRRARGSSSAPSRPGRGRRLPGARGRPLPAGAFGIPRGLRRIQPALRPPRRARRSRARPRGRSRETGTPTRARAISAKAASPGPSQSASSRMPGVSTRSAPQGSAGRDRAASSCVIPRPSEVRDLAYGLDLFSEEPVHERRLSRLPTCRRERGFGPGTSLRGELREARLPTRRSRRGPPRPAPRARASATRPATSSADVRLREDDERHGLALPAERGVALETPRVEVAVERHRDEQDLHVRREDLRGSPPLPRPFARGGCAAGSRPG